MRIQAIDNEEQSKGVIERDEARYVSKDSSSPPLILKKNTPSRSDEDPSSFFYMG